MTRYPYAWVLGCIALLPSALACSDDSGNDGSGGSSGSSGAAAGSAGAPAGGAGTGGTSGSSPGGSSPGGSPTAGSGGSGKGGSGGSPTGGSGGAGTSIERLMSAAEESCELLDMTVVVKFADEALGARLTGRVVEGSLSVEGADEVLQQEARLGHVVQLRWADGAADGAQVPVTGWVKQTRDPDSSSRYRCFDGEVRVRVNDGGDVFYIFAADAVSEATADGTCGAPTTTEEVHGCLPADY